MIAHRGLGAKREVLFVLFCLTKEKLYYIFLCLNYKQEKMKKRIFISGIQNVWFRMCFSSLKAGLALVKKMNGVLLIIKGSGMQLSFRCVLVTLARFLLHVSVNYDSNLLHVRKAEEVQEVWMKTGHHEAVHWESGKEKGREIQYYHWTSHCCYWFTI